MPSTNRLRRRTLIVGLALALGLAPLGVVLATELESPDLGGTWVTVLHYPEIGDIPFIGEISITAVVGVLSQVEQGGENVVLHDTYCRTEVLSSNPFLTTSVPESVMASLDPPPRTATFRRTWGAWVFEQDWHLEVRGAVLENPETDPLPISRFDDRVVDMDGDGNPGFTVPVSALNIVSGDTYVVQRLRYRLTGTLVSPNRIEGEVEWTSEQVVIDATDAFLMTTFEQWHDPEPSNHRFVMQRLPDHASCLQVNAFFESLLPAAAPESEGTEGAEGGEPAE